MATFPVVNFTQYQWVINDQEYLTKWNNFQTAITAMQSAINDFGEEVTVEKQAAIDAAAATAADRVATGNDATATAADRVATGNDADATASDRVQTAQDRVATGNDAVATAADRVQTGEDRTASAASASTALGARNEAQTARDVAVAAASAAEESAANVDGQNIVTIPGSGGSNEAGTAYAEDAQTGLYDSTAERLARVGAFGGYGASIITEPYPLLNVESIPSNIPSGKYTFDTTDYTGLPSFTGAVTFGTIEIFPVAEATNRNKLILRSGNGAVPYEEWERVHLGAGSWEGPWKKVGEAKYRDVVGDGDLYARGGIVGTVSQAGGVPTGAAFERDSNSFGTWTKHADGSMTCGGFYSGVVDITTTGFVTAGARRSATITQDYPQQFISRPVIEFTLSYSSTGPNTYFDITASQFTSVNSEIRYGMVFTAPVAVTGAEVRLSWTAFGRWY
ncbi:hypothetical protein LG331_09985 [Vreelandella aquamarina]|uniref:hypothetical protein n=1 Tax=Vreelandella aquamarina TaxID=77097 RepID=UPI00384DA981